MKYLPERDIFKLFLQKKYYTLLYKEVNQSYIKDNFTELSQLYRMLPRFHEQFPEEESTVDVLQAYFFTQYPDCDKELYLELFRILKEVTIDDEVALGIINAIKQREKALKLSVMAYKVGTGISNQEDFEKALSEYQQTQKIPELTTVNEFVTSDLEELLEGTYADSGLKFRLNCLKKSLGSLRKGDFGFIFARPEVGKTTFLASEISYMLQQLHNKGSRNPIIWFNNEEQGKKVFIRIYQAYFGVELDKLFANWKHYNKVFNEEVGHLLHLKDDANITQSLVERLVKQVEPSLIIFDQIDKIKGFSADRDDLLLGSIYQWARELAKNYAPVIGVCQSDGTGEGVKWLTMQHVANAKTSKQAEADWILGIGSSFAEGTEKLRYLNISKNKLTGDRDSNPNLRHGRFEVAINPSIAHYQDLTQYD